MSRSVTQRNKAVAAGPLYICTRAVPNSSVDGAGATLTTSVQLPDGMERTCCGRLTRRLMGLISQISSRDTLGRYGGLDKFGLQRRYSRRGEAAGRLPGHGQAEFWLCQLDGRWAAGSSARSPKPRMELQDLASTKRQSLVDSILYRVSGVLGEFCLIAHEGSLRGQYLHACNSRRHDLNR